MHFNAFCFRCKIYVLPLNGSSGLHRKQNVEIAFGFKSDTAVSQTFMWQWEGGGGGGGGGAQFLQTVLTVENTSINAH